MRYKDNAGDYIFLKEINAVDSINKILEDAKENKYVSIYIKIYYTYDFSSKTHVEVMKRIHKSGISVNFI